MNSAFRGNCADGLTQIAFKVTIGTLLGIKTSHQVLFPSSFSDSARKFFGRLLKIFRRVCPSAFIPPVQSNNLWKKLPKKLYFFYHFWKLNKLFRPAAEAFSAIVEIAFYVCRGTCRGKFYCFEEIRNSYQFRTMSERFPAFFQDIFVTIVKIAFRLSKVTNWGKPTRKKPMIFCLQFRTMSWKKLARRQTFWARTVKTAIYPSKGKKCLSRLKEMLSRFWTFIENFSAICPKVCGEVVKTEISISRGSCQGKTYCSQEITQFFIKLLLWVKSFHPSCKALLSDLSKDCILIDH